MFPSLKVIKMGSKRIELVQLRVGDLKLENPNPRKIKKKKREELERSLTKLGDFGVVVIDETDNVVSGFQRVQVLSDLDPDRVIDCKRLVGYSEQEKKIINIKANQHAGEWDIDALLDFAIDLTDLDLSDVLPETKEDDGHGKVIADMELRRFEKYDYLVIMCRNKLDYNELLRKLDLEKTKQHLTASKTVKARAIWYEEFEKRWH